MIISYYKMGSNPKMDEIICYNLLGS